MKGTKVFWGQGWPQVASRGSLVNLSYYDHAVTRNDECKSTARLFHAKARRREAWRASVPTSRFWSRSFSTSALGVGRSTFRWRGHLARVSWAGRPCHFLPLPLTYYFHSECFRNVSAGGVQREAGFAGEGRRATVNGGHRTGQDEKTALDAQVEIAPVRLEKRREAVGLQQDDVPDGLSRM